MLSRRITACSLERERGGSGVGSALSVGPWGWADVAERAAEERLDFLWSIFWVM